MSVTLDATQAPTVRDALPRAVRDLLERPLPLVMANVIWGVVALAAWFTMTIGSPWAPAFALLLIWPAATVAGIAARAVRGEPVVLADALRWPIRRPAVAVLGTLAILCAVVGIVDIQAALAREDLVGVAFATIAGWGLVGLGVVACVTWPLLGDPAHAQLPVTGLLRLSIAVVLSQTPRVVAASLAVTVLLLVSAVLAAAILTVSLSLSGLILARVVLPLADGLSASGE